MAAQSLTSADASRVAELNEYKVLDSAPDKTLHELAGLAASICGVPIALVSLIDSDRLWFKAAVGWAVTQLPRDSSICAHVIETGEMLVVPDTALDPRFAANPYVTGEPFVRFYAGAPLVTPNGHVVGVLCVIDRVPRQLAIVQLEALRVVSRQVMAHLELKRRNVELERIKKALQETDERWRYALEGSEEGVWDWNRETNQIYYSERWCTMLGYDSSEIGTGIDEWKSRVHPDDLEPTMARARAHLEGRTPYYASEHRIRAKDGSYRWMMDRGKVTVRAADGLALRFTGTQSDITLRKHAEEIASRLAAIVESSQDAIIGIDLNGVVTHWNKGAEKITGYTSAEMVGAPLKKVVPPDRHAEEDRILQQARLGQCVENLETKRQTKDGRWIDVSITASPIKDAQGKVIGVSKVSRDISDRKQADRALRESERQFASAFEFAAIGMALVSPDGKWLKVNRALCQIVGYTAEELFARTFQDITHPDDLQTDLNFVQQLLGGQTESYQMEKRYYHKAGHIVWVLLSVSLVRDDFGRPVHFISQIQDITERRRIEEQYRQSQKMEAIGQLAGGVAHDFNNILAAIMMQADMASLDPNIPKLTRDMLGEIEASAQRAANLTRQLLAFGRRQVMQQSQLDLNDTVRNLSKMLRRVLGEELHLDLRLSPTPLLTHADAGMLDQVLLNLAVNSRDAMPAGGHLTIETALVNGSDISNPQAGLGAGRYVTLTVSDTGHGIAPDVLPHIFEPFFTTKNPEKGTGLGLATVFGIIKQHGGSIVVNTKLDEGTSFQLFLPADDVAASTSPQAASHAAATGGGETILVVEDDSAVRMLTCTLLQRAGYHVIDAANGIDALRVWRRHKAAVRLLLTDMVMPEGLSGRALAAKLQDLNPNLRVVYTSGYSADIAGKEFTLGKGEEFVQKPCMPAHLLQAVRRCLDS